MEKKRSSSEPQARELKRSTEEHTTKKMESRSSGDMIMKPKKTKPQSECEEGIMKKKKNELQSGGETSVRQEKIETQSEGGEGTKKNIKLQSGGELTVKQKKTELQSEGGEMQKKTESQSEVGESSKQKQRTDESETEEDTSNVGAKLKYKQKVANAVITAKPMASRKLAKKCYKVIKKAAKHKNNLRKGFKDVQKYLCQCGNRHRKGKAIVVFAGDVTPVDVMIHLPAICEQNNIPYCYVPCRADLGAAAKIKRGSVMILVKEREAYKEMFDELYEELKHLRLEL